MLNAVLARFLKLLIILFTESVCTWIFLPHGTRGYLQTSCVRVYNVVSQYVLETYKQKSISSSRNLRSILKLESQRLALRVFGWMS